MSMMLLTAQAFPPRSGGIETLMSALARYAVDAGETVHVFADGDGAAEKFDQETKPPYNITRFSGIKPLRRRLKGHAVGKAVQHAISQNAVQEADVNMSVSKDVYIFADSWKSLEHLPAGLSVPVIAYAHGNEFPRPRAEKAGSPTHYPKHARIQKALSKASHLITVSRDTRGRAEPFLPGGLEASIIHPPIEPAPVADAADMQFAEELWPSSSVRLLALCRLIEWKGLDQAIKALALLRDDGVDAQLVIAGEGDDQTRLESLAAELGLLDRVKFAGRIEGGRKSALFESADIFVQPGRRVNGQCEGFGITYIEAALHGLPSISGNAGGAVDAVIDEVTGLVIDAVQPRNVSDALGRLIADKKLYKRLSRGAKAHGEAALWPQQIKRILALKER